MFFSASLALSFCFTLSQLSESLFFLLVRAYSSTSQNTAQHQTAEHGKWTDRNQLLPGEIQKAGSLLDPLCRRETSVSCLTGDTFSDVLQLISWQFGEQM